MVAYDVSDDGRRTRVAKALESWGDRVQYSVFEVDCDARQLATLVNQLEPLIWQATDSIRIYRLCGACANATHFVGARGFHSEPAAWVV